MTTAIIHVGLPKTGTTSFQFICAKRINRPLSLHGILYPLDQPFTFGAVQHQGLAVGVETESFEWIDNVAARLREISADHSTLLISSERFAASLNDPKNHDRTRAFRDALNREFDRVEFVCTIRSERSILTSMLRTKIEGHGLPLDGPSFVRNEVDTFFAMNRAVAEIFAGQLRVLRFEELVAQPFPASLLKACTGVELDMPEEKRNTTENKDSRRLLIGYVRALLYNYLGEPSPFTAKIRDELLRIRDGIQLDPEIDAEISQMLTDWIDRQLEETLRGRNDSLEAIYGLPAATT